MILKIQAALWSKKTFWTILLAFPTAAIIDFIQKYIYDDWGFLISLAVLVLIDSVLGVANAWRKHEVSSKGFGQVIVKLLVYTSVLVTVHVLCNFTVGGEKPATIGFITDFSFASLIVREAISIFENVALLKPDIVPSWLLKRLKAFDSETGNEIKK